MDIDMHIEENTHSKESGLWQNHSKTVQTVIHDAKEDHWSHVGIHEMMHTLFRLEGQNNIRFYGRDPTNLVGPALVGFRDGIPVHLMKLSQRWNTIGKMRWILLGELLALKANICNRLISRNYLRDAVITEFNNVMSMCQQLISQDKKFFDFLLGSLVKELFLGESVATVPYAQFYCVDPQSESVGSCSYHADDTEIAYLSCGSVEDIEDVEISPYSAERLDSLDLFPEDMEDMDPSSTSPYSSDETENLHLCCCSIEDAEKVKVFSCEAEHADGSQFSVEIQEPTYESVKFWDLIEEQPMWRVLLPLGKHRYRIADKIHTLCSVGERCELTAKEVYNLSSPRWLINNEIEEYIRQHRSLLIEEFLKERTLREIVQDWMPTVAKEDLFVIGKLFHKRAQLDHTDWYRTRSKVYDEQMKIAKQLYSPEQFEDLRTIAREYFAAKCSVDENNNKY
jgi:hypothetical protein